MSNPKTIIFESDCMKAVLKIAHKVAKTSSSAIIIGESGVGKEMIANYIHQSGKRSRKPFVKVNCAAIPENLLESELFGYKKGAFTGSDPAGKIGLFTKANGGVIFLDEVTEMPLNLQVKLLRVLQEKEVLPIGALEPTPLDVQVVSATNKDIDQLIEAGKFREDLFYRLHVVPIRIPPLRERISEIPVFAKYFLNKFNEQYGLRVSLEEEAVDLLKKQHWYGNVRELEHTLERIVITSDSDLITAEELKTYLPKKDHKKSGIIIERLMPLQEAIDSVEEQLITMAMQQYNSIIMSAKVLEVSQPTLSRKYKKIKEKWVSRRSGQEGLEQKLGVLEQELDKQLRSVTIVLAASINPDEIKQLLSHISFDNPAYSKLQKKLTSIREVEGGIEWSYIWHIGEDGQIINMVCDRKLNISPGEGYFGPPEMRNAVFKAVNGVTSVTPKYRDAYGEYKSCVTPIRDESGHVIAILGADYSLQYIDNQLQKLSQLLLAEPEA